MVAFLVIQIKRGKITVDDVPERYRAAVIEALEEEMTDA